MVNRDLTPWNRSPGLSPLGGRDAFGSFRREMDRLFDDFLAPAETRSFATPPAAGQAAVWPRLDLEESEQAYVITAELPGIDPRDVDLNLKDNVLTISGEKRAEREETNGGRRYSERSFGRFERTIAFDTEVDADRIKATCGNGVLTITVPKNAQARNRSRRIEIRPQPSGGEANAASGADGQ